MNSFNMNNTDKAIILEIVVFIANDVTAGDMKVLVEKTLVMQTTVMWKGSLMVQLLMEQHTTN